MAKQIARGAEGDPYESRENHVREMTDPVTSGKALFACAGAQYPADKTLARRRLHRFDDLARQCLVDAASGLLDHRQLSRLGRSLKYQPLNDNELAYARSRLSNIAVYVDEQAFSLAFVEIHDLVAKLSLRNHERWDLANTLEWPRNIAAWRK